MIVFEEKFRLISLLPNLEVENGSFLFDMIGVR
jgi:hypothetical protein